MRIVDLGTVAWSTWDGFRAGVSDGVSDLILAPLAATPAVLSVLAPLLPPDERTAAERFGTPGLRDRAIVSRGLLRLLLSLYARQPASTLQIGIEATGKPILLGDATTRSIAFNLSHAGDWLLYAIARAPVGVDIEEIVPIPDLDRFVHVSLGEAERAYHASLPAKSRLAHVYRTWVCKEALAKCTGTGIGKDLSADLGRDGVLDEIAIFTPRVGYVAALATQNRVGLRFLRVPDLADLIDFSR